MERWTITLVICAAYLVASLVMGVLPGRKVSHSVTGYVAGDRAMNVLVLYFVMGASIFSSFAFLGGPGWAYSRGMAALYIIAYGVIGMVPLYFFGPRARRLGARYGFVTQAELLAHRYDQIGVSVLLAVLSVAAFIPYLVLQMKGAGYILSVISEGRVPEWVGALAAYGVVLVYVLTSGVMGVGWTNTFQGVFMMAVAWFLGLYLPYVLHGGVESMFSAIIDSARAELLAAPGLDSQGNPWTWAGYSSAVLVSGIGFCMWPHLFMRSYAARSERALKLTVVLYTTFQVFLIPILFVGFAGILAFPGVTPADTIVPHILSKVDLPSVIVGLICAGVLAASMSSGDSILHAAASIGVRDGIRPLAGAGFDDAAERLTIRILVVVLSAVAYFFAVGTEVSLIALLLGAYGGVAQIFPLVFGAFYWPRATGAGALAGLLVGLSINTLFLIFPDLRPWPLHEGIYGLAGNVVAYVGVSLATDPMPASRWRPYISAGRRGAAEKPGR
ncbi:sodium:solute symporter family protein [Haliangium sp.]|uniref:sodium:solute symporter family protein n=1 Tax=Haliangium sp. TaxID=2663208 RepID=UPI003D129076